jgi:hypothetical protein
VLIAAFSPIAFLSYALNNDRAGWEGYFKESASIISNFFGWSEEAADIGSTFSRYLNGEISRERAGISYDAAPWALVLFGIVFYLFS